MRTILLLTLVIAFTSAFHLNKQSQKGITSLYEDDDWEKLSEALEFCLETNANK